MGAFDGCSFQAASFQSIFVPAQVVAELVEVGEPDFVPEYGFVVFGHVVDVSEEQKNVRGGAVAEAAFRIVGVSDKQAQNVVFEFPREEVVRGKIMANHRHASGYLSDGRGQA